MVKIFSLQSKTSLAAWSVGLGFILYLAFAFPATGLKSAMCPAGTLCPQFVTSEPWVYSRGWPIQFENNQPSGILNGASSLVTLNIAALADLLFWILAVLIVLSLARYFRKKDY